MAKSNPDDTPQPTITKIHEVEDEIDYEAQPYLYSKCITCDGKFILGQGKDICRHCGSGDVFNIHAPKLPDGFVYLTQYNKVCLACNHSFKDYNRVRCERCKSITIMYERRVATKEAHDDIVCSFCGKPGEYPGPIANKLYCCPLCGKMHRKGSDISVQHNRLIERSEKKNGKMQA